MKARCRGYETQLASVGLQPEASAASSVPPPPPPPSPGGAAGGAGSAGDTVEAAKLQLHIDGLSRATGVLAKRNQALAASLQSASLGSGSSSQLSQNARSYGGGVPARAPPELAEMHQRLLQLHVGFVMHAGQEAKVDRQPRIELLPLRTTSIRTLATYYFSSTLLICVVYTPPNPPHPLPITSERYLSTSPSLQP